MLTSALIGTGQIASSLHLPAHRGLSGSRLEWVCDVDEQAARQFAERFGIPKWTTRLEEVLSDLGVDWVDIATPNRTHEALAVQAMSAGKHVLCQKPMAHSAEAAERMVRTASETGRQLGILMSFRSDPILGSLRSMIEAGAFGQISHYRGKMVSSGGFRLNRGDWREQEAAGALDLLGIHLIDLFHWMENDAIQWVQSMSRTLYAPMKGDDVTLAIYGFESGVTALRETTYCSYAREGMPVYALEINGTEGRAAYQIETGQLTLQLKRGYEGDCFSCRPNETHAFKFAPYGSDAHVHRVHQQFVDSLAGEEPFPLQGEAGVRAMRLIEATRRSSAKHKRVVL
ncbi:Gfo/Idh/MocA family protein [Cohnella cellulosilytica]|uniref:Gfo/Idh/MocA family protein n=1 Tax=Cohnella cellulosilytica TaxID=986710 RepID=A0ABW2FA20_9BACL